jgi:transposase-like protein
MQTVSQMVERHAHGQARARVRQIVQTGTVRAVIEAEINTVIAEALNGALEGERDAVLGRASYERLDDSGIRNGHRTVRVPGLLGPLTLKQPLLRVGGMVSPVLRALRAAAHAGIGVLAVRGWLRGLSTRAVSEELRAATGARISASTVSTLTNALAPVAEAWTQRPIPGGIQYLLLDAFYLPVRRRAATTTQALLVALGIGADGSRSILGFCLGDRESEDTWGGLLRDLLARGLQRDALCLVVSDEHKAIEAAVAKVLALRHQLCLVHRMRNVRYRVATADRAAFLADFRAIFWAPNREAALTAAGRFGARWERAYPKAVRLTLDRLESGLEFFAEPKGLWPLLRSTNLIERFIRESRRRLDSAGAMQGEGEVTKLFWSISVEQEKRWAKRRYWSGQHRVVVAMA